MQTETVKNFCTSDLTPRDRAVVFLDPFGNQVKWPTIQTIAKTSGIDLWYLFPSGLGVVRQLSADGEIEKDAEQSINELFGTKDWYSALTIQSQSADLFDANKEVRIKVATADAVTRFMIARMRTIFKGGVLENGCLLAKEAGIGTLLSSLGQIQAMPLAVWRVEWRKTSCGKSNGWPFRH